MAYIERSDLERFPSDDDTAENLPARVINW
jgi:hypothetical protein